MIATGIATQTLAEEWGGVRQFKATADEKPNQMRLSQLNNAEICEKQLISLAPRAGFEPATIRLTVECSTAELPRNRANQVRAGQRITKPPSLAKDEMGHAGATPPGNGKALGHGVLSSLFTAQKQRSGSCRGDPAAQPCRQLTANSSQSPITLDVAAFH